jgi:hypothetical protein
MGLIRKCVITMGLCVAAPFGMAAGIGISGDLGTTGVGIKLRAPVGPQFSARLGANAFNYSYTSSTVTTSYDADLRYRTIDALIDWHPMRNSLRLTGGLVFNNSNIDLRARPSAAGVFRFSGNTYPVSDIGEVEGTIDYRRVAPYLGIGWSNDRAGDKGGWSFTSDVGVMFLGRPDVTLNSTGCHPGSSLSRTTLCNRLATDLPNERARVEEEVKDYRFYPVIRLGAMYRF